MPDELYRKMGYGKVYFVEGSDSSLLNEYMRANAKRIEERVNHDERNWVTCSLVCLDAHNSLFASGPHALFYSALIPSENDAEGAFPFLKATLREPEPHLFALFDAYFESLQHAFDDALDGEDNFFYSLNEESLSMPDAECLMAESCDYSCVEPSVDAFYDRKLKPSSASMERADRMFSFGSARMRRSLCEPSRLQITPCTYDVLLPDYQRDHRPHAYSHEAVGNDLQICGHSGADHRERGAVLPHFQKRGDAVQRFRVLRGAYFPAGNPAADAGFSGPGAP